MNLRYDGAYKLFLLDCSAKDAPLAKRAGFKYVKQWQLFASPHLTSVKKIASKHDAYTNDFLQSMEKIFDAEYNASRAVSPSSYIGVPLPLGKTLKHYQFPAIEYLSARERSLLADDMGLGKTVEIIATTNYWNINYPLSKILIVCPANAKINWMREWMSWSTLAYTPVIAQTTMFPKNPNVVIINYDILVRLDAEIKAHTWDLVVFDEAHMLKESKSLRTKHAFGGYVTKKVDGVARKKWVKGIDAKKVIMATGSPVVNYTIELYPLLKFLSPYGWGDKMQFARRYCDLKVIAGRFDFKGSCNEEELNYKLRTTVMLRRTKDVVAKFLPPKIRTIYELEATGKLAKSSATVADAVRANMGKSLQDFTTADWEQAITGMKGWRNKDKTKPIATIREEESHLKAPMVITHLKQELMKHKKVVVFCYHRAMVKALKEEFGCTAVTLTGETSTNDRQRAVDMFQNNSDIKVFIGNVRAAGTAITLTAASLIVFAEYDWTPGVMFQAEDRIHRIGQTADHVLIQYLAIRDSIDAHILKTIMSKTKTINKIVK
jgi:SWI/SNF-related matrix-associated actin-dependent regulator 1 of chromatin subfamily A